MFSSERSNKKRARYLINEQETHTHMEDTQSKLEPLLDLTATTFADIGLDSVDLSEARQAVRQSTVLTVTWGLHQLSSQPNADDIKQGVTCRKHVATIMDNYEEFLKDVPEDLVNKCKALLAIDLEVKNAKAPVPPLADGAAVALLADQSAEAGAGNGGAEAEAEAEAVPVADDEPASKRSKDEDKDDDKPKARRARGRGRGRGGSDKVAVKATKLKRALAGSPIRKRGGGRKGQ